MERGARAWWGAVALGMSAAAVGCSQTKTAAGPAEAAGPVRIVVDAGAGQHAISPLIYGVAFATPHQLQELNAPVNRAGGDSSSMFNWKTNARNSGHDWFFETVPCGDDVLQQYGDKFVEMSKDGGARAMATVPMLGWVAKLQADGKKVPSYSIVKYGLQQKTDAQGFPEAGDGVTIAGKPITWNDPNDAAEPDSLAREQEYVKHLVGKWKTAAKGGVAYFLLDNEPARWHDIHRDVHPEGTHANELAEKTIAFAKMIKGVDPTAKVVGPEEWVPPGYAKSGFDQQRDEMKDMSKPADRDAQQGGMEFLPWLLTQWKNAGHPVDVVSVHFYPQGGEYRDGSTDLSEAMQLLRNRSTRLLWDKSYHDTSWMGGTIALIPSLRSWVDRYYVPGTPIAVTEYSWGAENSMNGATTEADVLGIFGRENLSMATRWIVPGEETPTFQAMKMFRNYDGKKSGFGETSVSDAAPDVDKVSSFAALRASDHALTIAVINKQLKDAATVDVAVKNFGGEGTVETVRLADGVMAMQPAGVYREGVVHAVLPPQSVSLLILHDKGQANVYSSHSTSSY